MSIYARERTLSRTACGPGSFWTSSVGSFQTTSTTITTIITATNSNCNSNNDYDNNNNDNDNREFTNGGLVKGRLAVKGMFSICTFKTEPNLFQVRKGNT